MRTYSPTASSEISDYLTALTLPPEQTGVALYQQTMTRLGESFVRLHRDSFLGVKRLLLICTNEDADYLGRGVLSGLESIHELAVSVACFWNDRASIPGALSGLRVELAPIVRRYVEPGPADAFLVVKSIISSACVVRTNITELVYELDPSRIFIFAPVVLKGAEAKLSEEFDDEVAMRFEFFWFAEDDEKEGEDVKPGIGGQIYERLGIGSKSEKNRYTPALIRERRKLPV